MKTAGTPVYIKYNGNPLNLTPPDDWDINDHIEGTCTISGTLEMDDYDWLVFCAFIYSFIYDS